MGADAVGEEPDEGVVEQQPYHTDGGKEEELDEAVLELRGTEYPNATDDVVDEQPRDEREGGREQVVQPGILGEDIEQPEIDDKGKAAHEEIAHELHEQPVGGAVEQALEEVTRLHHLLSWYSSSVLTDHTALLSVLPAAMWSTATMAVIIEWSMLL